MKLIMELEPGDILYDAAEPHVIVQGRLNAVWFDRALVQNFDQNWGAARMMPGQRFLLLEIMLGRCTRLHLRSQLPSIDSIGGQS